MMTGNKGNGAARHTWSIFATLAKSFRFVQLYASREADNPIGKMIPQNKEMS